MVQCDLPFLQGMFRRFLNAIISVEGGCNRIALITFDLQAFRIT